MHKTMDYSISIIELIHYCVEMTGITTFVTPEYRPRTKICQL